MNHIGIIETALSWMAQKRDVALATVTSTWGSSPRPVGSQMIIDTDGTFHGSVSSGCVEGDVIAQAAEVIECGSPRMLSFGVTTEQAWESRLSCGGNIDIWVEPAESQVNILKELNRLLHKRDPICLVTDLVTGKKWITRPHSSEDFAQLPLGMENAVGDLISRRKSAILSFDKKRFFLHGIVPTLRLVIIGGVHIAISLARMATMAGYQVDIIDPRKEFANRERFPQGSLNVQWPADAMKERPLCESSAVVALSHDPIIDDPALMKALESDAFYIGVLGSRKTHASRIKRLVKKGVSETALQRLHAPVGLPIGGKSPDEIAVSIMAEIIQTWYHPIC